MKKKFPGQPKLDEAYGLVQFGCQGKFLNLIISKLDKHVVFLLINYIAIYSVNFIQKETFHVHVLGRQVEINNIRGW